LLNWLESDESVLTGLVSFLFNSLADSSAGSGSAFGLDVHDVSGSLSRRAMDAPHSHCIQTTAPSTPASSSPHRRCSV
jgi:hypothetical protein